MLREFRESDRLSCSACDFAPTPNPLRGKRESSLPYPLDFCLFCSSILCVGGGNALFLGWGNTWLLLSAHFTAI